MAMAPQRSLSARAMQAASAATDLGGLLGILRRNFWKILLATIASTILALTYLATAKPQYTTTASLFVDPRTRKVVSEEVVQGGFGSDLALVESQVSIITSDAVLKRVVDKLDLAKDPEYAPPQGNGIGTRIKTLLGRKPLPMDPTSQALSNLAQSIKVRRAQKTYVVDVDVTGSDPVRTASVANAIVEAYLADQTAAKAAEAKRANALIDARLGELRDQVRQAETHLDDFKRNNKILTAEGGIVTEQQLTKLNGELINTRAVAAEYKAKFDEIQQLIKSGAGPDVLPDAIRSGLIQRLREQYAQVARREASLAAQLQPRHPVLIDVRSQLAEVKAQISAELKRISVAAHSEYQIATAREKDIARQLEGAKADVTQSNTAQIKVRELEQEATASRELLRLFLARAKETQEQQNTSTPDARIITPPAIPTKPSKPVTWLILALGLMGGLGLGVASALVTDHLDTSVRNPRDLFNMSPSGTVASIPALTGSNMFARVRQTAAEDRPRAAQFSDLLSAVADTKGRREIAYRQAILRLLARIKGQQRPGRPHTAMFVSPVAGAGNSATTLAVAYAAALSGERVLLVDATSTNPQLSEIFATNLPPTSVVVLDSKEHLNRITTHDSRSGLSFLPIALADLRSLKTQQRRRLIAGLNGLSQNYDLIFIDAGGLLEDESALSLLPAADQIMVVARSGVSSKSDIAETFEILDTAQDRITGTVMTMTGDSA